MEQNSIVEDAAEIPAGVIRKKRSPWVALLVALLAPGLGQIYNDQIRKGLLFMASVYLLTFLFALIGVLNSFYGLVAFVVFEIGFRIYIVYDAIKVAKTSEVEFPIPGKLLRLKWTLALTIVVVTGLLNLKTITGYQSFIIPTTGNEPTLFVDDRLVADMRYYNSHEPTYGDMVVFIGEDGLHYCFRVAGLPGDKFQMINDIPSVNGIVSETEFICDTISEMMTGIKKYRETLPDQHAHFLLLSDWEYETMIKSTDEIVIPADHYYLLGDNRHNALDSRYRGLIHRADIVGKCLYTYWGVTTDRINVSVK